MNAICRSISTCYPRRLWKCELWKIMVTLGVAGLLFTVGVINKYNLLRFIPLQRGECYLTEQEQNELRHILRHLVAIFDDMNVTYWLDYGTLIGALRYGDIMRWVYFDISELNLVPRVSHRTAASLAPWGGKMRDPGNEVALNLVFFPLFIFYPFYRLWL